MSVTFDCPQAPVQRIAPYADEPDYFEVVPVEPFTYINVANSNARDILALIDPVENYDDLCGCWNQADLARVRVNLVRILNTKAKERLIEPSFIDAGNGGCTMVYQGRDMDYVMRRLTQFLELVKVAMDHGFDVTFG